VGKITLPISGKVYADTSTIIYTVEKHPTYWGILRPLWVASQAGQLQMITSELAVLECLVGPMKTTDAAREAEYEFIFNAGEIQLLPITGQILRKAAHLRASFGMKTPDAIYAATAISAGCAALVGNDTRFRRLTAISVIILDDLITP
jgi:predicted nucleic acid-binding protein